MKVSFNEKCDYIIKKLRSSYKIGKIALDDLIYSGSKKNMTIEDINKIIMNIEKVYFYSGDKAKYKIFEIKRSSTLVDKNSMLAINIYKKYIENFENQEIIYVLNKLTKNMFQIIKKTEKVYLKNFFEYIFENDFKNNISVLDFFVSELEKEVFTLNKITIYNKYNVLENEKLKLCVKERFLKKNKNYLKNLKNSNVIIERLD